MMKPHDEAIKNKLYFGMTQGNATYGKQFKKRKQDTKLYKQYDSSLSFFFFSKTLYRYKKKKPEDGKINILKR